MGDAQLRHGREVLMSSIDRTRGVCSPASTLAPRAALRNPLGAVVDAAKQGLADIPRFVKMGQDVFEASHLRELNRLFGGSAKPDRLSDGKFIGAKGQTFEPGTP